ncbi:MAG: hypothetical protein U0736_12000 [Gemmataceae bacterium]
MGKILDTFRPADPTWVAPTPASTPVVAEAPPAVDDEAVEVPFIEIGPRRKIVAASPGVLAMDPPTPALPRPHGVAFRSLDRLKPRAKFAAGLIAYHTPDAPAATAFRDLLSAVVEAARGRKSTAGVFLFTAVRSGIGSTTVLLNLAITAAASGRRIVVVDANLRRPAVAGLVDLPIAPGLAEVLAGEIGLTDAVRPTGQENLFVLSSGAPAPLWADGGVGQRARPRRCWRRRTSPSWSPAAEGASWSSTWCSPSRQPVSDYSNYRDWDSVLPTDWESHTWPRKGWVRSCADLHSGRPASDPGTGSAAPHQLALHLGRHLSAAQHRITRTATILKIHPLGRLELPSHSSPRRIHQPGNTSRGVGGSNTAAQCGDGTTHTGTTGCVAGRWQPASSTWAGAAAWNRGGSARRCLVQKGASKRNWCPRAATACRCPRPRRRCDSRSDRIWWEPRGSIACARRRDGVGGMAGEVQGSMPWRGRRRDASGCTGDRNCGVRSS